LIVFNKCELQHVPGNVEQTIESAIIDQRFSHLTGKQLMVLHNGRAIAGRERASAMVSDGDELSVMEIFFGG